ncbi:MAG TPA: pyridoxamine kinase [Candidatus Syntrophosphaera sp.]|jgi:pyridoxine kinase|nr:pyridoxamine kinase [Candidatus Syntrophosphaera sp.]HOH48831.1 pyridoxamine kinase [Candidatus Syntrophosphaera sp.]HPW37960.1 pyridoxamine kinase [Candidatus Syntrophosphaera sp.]HPX67202.1 pyridoxamine kinase [Candidatus Syntrophosphaera sp.]HQC47790.1 pyridoxamine kinase [Candidatus Syntrophosphaera sp.]
MTTNTASKRILAVHDLSSFGHTSLMAFIPIMYRLGIRVCALPTAILSANTDFPNPLWIDFSDQIEPFADHWKALELRFDAISTGFLASAEQAELVGKAIDRLKQPGTLVAVDPVMGDQGSLYSCFGPPLVDAMRRLVAKAELITPNFTEAALLAGADPTPRAEPDEVRRWCQAIAASGPEQIVVTSVPTADPNQLEVLHYNAPEDSLSRLPFAVSPGHKPGAGDCFAALLLAGLVNGHSLPTSLKATVRIMSRAILEELPPGADWREGIAMENMIQWDLQAYYRE